KYIYLKHSAIQSARSQASEYTVGYDASDARGTLADFNPGIATFRVPSQSLAVALHEARVRNMSAAATAAAAHSADTVGAIRPLEANDKFRSYTPNALWRDHRGLPFFTGTTAINEAATDDDTPTITLFGVDVGSWLNTLVDVVQIGFDAVS